MGAAGSEVVKSGVIEVSYADAFYFILDYAKEISRGFLNISLTGSPFSLHDMVDIDLFLPQTKTPIKMMARVAKHDEIAGSSGRMCRLSLKLEPFSDEARLVLGGYLRAFQSKKTARVNTRRKNLRYNVDLPAAIHFEKQNGEGRVVELSKQGARLNTPSAMKIGQSLSCVIFLPDMTRLFVFGNVLSADNENGHGFSYAVRFTSFEANSEYDLQSYLEQIQSYQEAPAHRTEV